MAFCMDGVWKSCATNEPMDIKVQVTVGEVCGMWC